jgi:hypothetical protein
MFADTTAAAPRAAPGRSALLARELNAAAMQGDDERVKRLLGQLLTSRNRRSDDRLREQLSAWRNFSTPCAPWPSPMN